MPKRNRDSDTGGDAAPKSLSAPELLSPSQVAAWQQFLNEMKSTELGTEVKYFPYVGITTSAALDISDTSMSSLVPVNVPDREASASVQEQEGVADFMKQYLQ